MKKVPSSCKVCLTSHASSIMLPYDFRTYLIGHKNDSSSRELDKKILMDQLRRFAFEVLKAKFVYLTIRFMH